MSYFLLLSLHRTGSTMLCNMLSRHPELVCQHELFVRPELREDWRGTLDRYATTAGPVAVGHGHLAHMTPDMLTAPDAKRLVLVREDLDLSTLSWMLMSAVRPDGQWKMNPDRFKRMREQRRKDTEALLQYADAVVTYEELTDNEQTDAAPQDVADRLCAFFGVDPHPLTTGTRKRRRSFPKNWGECRG